MGASLHARALGGLCNWKSRADRGSGDFEPLQNSRLRVKLHPFLLLVLKREFVRTCIALRGIVKVTKLPKSLIARVWLRKGLKGCWGVLVFDALGIKAPGLNPSGLWKIGIGQPDTEWI